MALQAVATGADAAELSAPYATATLQHLGLLKRKQERLHAARMDAEGQFLHSVAAAWAAGDLDKAELAEAFQDYRRVAAPGFKTRWDAAIPVSAAVMMAWPANSPNGPAGSWEGPYPINGGPAPQRLVSVVYVLFDATNEPCYVGSTCTFRDRLAWHKRDGKQFVRWVAYPCPGRDAAYQLEMRLMSEHMPYLNKRRGR